MNEHFQPLLSDKVSFLITVPSASNSTTTLVGLTPSWLLLSSQTLAILITIGFKTSVVLLEDLFSVSFDVAFTLFVQFPSDIAVNVILKLVDLPGSKIPR